MIILEGPDNSGKTTLALQLSQEYGYQYIRSLGPQVGLEGFPLYDFCMHWLQVAREFRGRLCFDRFPFFSEQVYGPIVRDSLGLNQEQLSDIKIELMRTSPLIIFCYTFDPNIGTDGKAQMSGVVENYTKIRSAYYSLFEPYSKTHGWFSIYDYTKPELVRGTVATVVDYTQFVEDKRRERLEV